MKRFNLWPALLCAALLAACGEPAPMDWADGSYRGECRAGKPDGYGYYESADGRETYLGNWQDGRPEGLGRRVCADSVYEGCFRAGERTGEGRMDYPDGSCYRGAWLRNRRHGYGELTDSAGSVLRGCWAADTLATGERVERGAFYRGAFGGDLQPGGYGIYRTPDGTYYAGAWEGGRRHGFGFGLEPHQVVKCGIWKGGRFLGERMVYNENRVYGIDISKHQHVFGRRTQGIDWDALRITRLGPVNPALIQNGRADYPVSFIYIKATQGIRITNAFYARDVKDARARAYPVGAYHFFSPIDGARQATYFLKVAAPRRGDLPPMLDVELSDRQIREMGGPQAMFREVMAWMRVVERHCGVRPVLYVGQYFVNKYMEHAPAELQAYKVWIARYGEYKPYVHLLYWQLSAQGRVSGIRGDVDIDVFNGTKEQFQEYLKTSCVR